MLSTRTASTSTKAQRRHGGSVYSLRVPQTPARRPVLQGAGGQGDSPCMPPTACTRRLSLCQRPLGLRAHAAGERGTRTVQAPAVIQPRFAEVKLLTSTRQCLPMHACVQPTQPTPTLTDTCLMATPTAALPVNTARCACPRPRTHGCGHTRAQRARPCNPMRTQRRTVEWRRAFHRRGRAWPRPQQRTCCCSAPSCSMHARTQAHTCTHVAVMHAREPALPRQRARTRPRPAQHTCCWTRARSSRSAIRPMHEQGAP